MYVIIGIMRTTVEMKPEHRTALLALAAQRGQKGFSSVLAEAIDEYLKGERGDNRRRRELLSLGGILAPEDASELRAAASLARRNWR
jgi:hypothetical protein